MLTCERDPSLTAIKTGFYGKVAIVDGSLLCPSNLQYSEKRGAMREIGRKLTFGRWGGSFSDEVDAIMAMGAHNAINHQQITNLDLIWFNTLSQPFDEQRLTYMAKYFNEIVREYHGPTPRLKYDLGLYLSDLAEILPPPVASTMLLAASEPARSKHFMGEVEYGNSQGPDNQRYAVASVALLPRDTRLGLFTSMAGLSTELTNSFFGFLASNWSTNLNGYGGMRSIYDNLEGEQASTKVLEVQEDFSAIREIIEKAKSAKS